MGSIVQAAEQERGLDAALRAVADPTRRGILRLVRDRERAVGDLAAHFPAISQPAVSQHLRVLSEAKLVTARRDGNRRLYHARGEGLSEAWAFLDEMWRDRLTRLKLAAERDQSETRKTKTRRKRRQR